MSSRRHPRVLFALGLALAACNARPVEKLEGLMVFDPGDAGMRNDLGVRPDATSARDAGVRDAEPSRDREPGQDRAPPGACEGCECRSTEALIQIPFARENCQDGLVCVSWDLFAGLTVGVELEGPTKSCLRPCTRDRECGAGRRCASLGFLPETGADKVCVDSLAGADEYCSGSRSNREQMIDPVVGDGADEIIGCEEGLTCQLFQFPTAFNPDESVCAALCETDADCARVPNLPYCNPRALDPASTRSPVLGVCSDGKHPNGALCGSTDPNEVFRLSTGCDTSVETCGMNREACPLCVGINLDANRSLTPEGMGICVSACSAMNPCAGGRECVPNFFSSGEGVCSDACDAMPDTCSGSGSLGHGQDCLELNLDASFCIDRYAPPLLPAAWNSDGMITSPGEDCTGELENYSFFRCPDGATCVPAPDQGFCIYGCTVADPNTGDALCKTLLNSADAVCTEQQPGFGVCGEQ